MKRLHIHIKTNDLEQSITFYSAMLGAPPSKKEDDYAQWLIDEPAANIAVSTRGGQPGIGHVGISLDDRESLNDIAERMRGAGQNLTEETDTTCCYAKSDKFWAHDPQGAIWELFHSFGKSEHYGAAPKLDFTPAESPCCG